MSSTETNREGRRKRQRHGTFIPTTLILSLKIRSIFFSLQVVVVIMFTRQLVVSHRAEQHDRGVRLVSKRLSRLET